MKKQIKPLEACRLDLFTSEDELREKYSEPIALRVLRIREEYNWFLSNPDAKDRQFVENVTSRFGLNKTQAYSDLAIVKALLPHLSQGEETQGYEDDGESGFFLCEVQPCGPGG